MLFNSAEFIFLFLPIAAIGFYLLGAICQPTLATAWLTLLSLIFYGAFAIDNLWILIPSISINFMLGSKIASAPGTRLANLLLRTGVIGNLLILGYFKYAGLITETVSSLAGTSHALSGIALPLGISFFTFTQIAFLVDANRGIAREYRLVHYCLFVTYFPHLVAGPILHHKEMMPQFERRETYCFDFENISVGITVFAIGLFKKVVLADGIAPYANQAFAAAARGEDLGLIEAWCGALAYTMQLYFDFSGYSDMAVGISRIFGIRLPINFYSPYKSSNIIEFWRRWHITLSRFLRDYLYISLGGNRNGSGRRFLNLVITMLLGGLWHGAGWTFVVWGGLHGVYLIVNHAWNAFAARIGLLHLFHSQMGFAFSWLLTFISIVVAWVFFRAENIPSAVRMIEAMFGGNGVSLPDYFVPRLGTFGRWLVSIGVRPTAGGSAFGGTPQVLWILGLMAIALLSPNSQQLLAKYQPGLCSISDPHPFGKMQWSPNLKWASFTIFLLFASILNLGRTSDFLYWQF